MHSKVPDQRWRRCLASVEAGDTAYASLDIHEEIGGQPSREECGVEKKWPKTIKYREQCDTIKLAVV